ncbi:DUF262 domain-containing protein [Corallococcus sp. AB030]|uniref:DUF262 domain-containing protein n=1 Tax=Corallococcus TaxID=83461 RepID=UPI000ED4A4DB|nr:MULTISPECIES: DUF262 domain-containing protein [Corallococcus]NRD58008.1 DUF262 domain-containing protein [Corallococcus exiguus]RKI15644.1 DUF262 domain-containing protein [Corallococcus sp. AB030]RUO88029.1 DUF262 domain-containing protein [Corallococcus sp. AB018]
MEKTRLERRPEARAFMVDTLLQHVQDGRIRVPDFQRPLKWRATHVLDLFDSVYRGFPVGDLLLFKGPAEPASLHFGPLRIDAPRMTDAYFVVDGQQRLTALAAAMLHPDRHPRGDIHSVWFDLEAEQFVHLRAAEPPPHWIPVNVVADSFKLLTWLNEWPFRSTRPDLVQGAIALGKALREYQVPSYIVESTSQEVMRLIFTRVNTSGVPMRESEVFEALFGGQKPRPIESACNRLQAETGFGKITTDLFIHCLKAVEGIDLRQNFIRRGGAVDSVHPEAVERTETALRHAIGFLADDVGIPHRRLLPYPLSLIVLTRFFHLHPRPHPRTRTLLSRWVWRGALSKVHAEAALENIQKLQSDIDESEFDSVDRLLERLPLVFNLGFALSSTPWSVGSVEMRLCALALLHLGPRDPESGERFRLDEIRTWLDERDLEQVFIPIYPGAQYVVERYLLPNEEKFHAFKSASVEVLRSHALDEHAVKSLDLESPHTLIDRRNDILDEWLNQFFSERIASDDGDRPPIAELLRRVDAQVTSP